MEKVRALQLLGGTQEAAAAAIGITQSAVSLWPDPLPARLADRVVAAIARRLLPAETLGLDDDVAPATPNRRDRTAAERQKRYRARNRALSDGLTVKVTGNAVTQTSEAAPQRNEISSRIGVTLLAADLEAESTAPARARVQSACQDAADSAHAVTAAAYEAMLRLGIKGIDLPSLGVQVRAGATEAEIAALAREGAAMGRGSWDWVLAALKSRRAAAARRGLQM